MFRLYLPILRDFRRAKAYNITGGIDDNPSPDVLAVFGGRDDSVRDRRFSACRPVFEGGGQLV
jgi:hypothetical protein